MHSNFFRAVVVALICFSANALAADKVVILANGSINTPIVVASPEPEPEPEQFETTFHAKGWGSCAADLYIDGQYILRISSSREYKFSYTFKSGTHSVYLQNWADSCVVSGPHVNAVQVEVKLNGQLLARAKHDDRYVFFKL
ncbi:hypothetical protein MJO52_12000 [Microbulbifer variabilis]|uniref:DUF2846 domain-containing protein n=1 Tax=Microbulbifer variabilis TaxID=266805 RepID=A0ABY4V6B5_9GAMM|nr:hypothetical protein [Microbulbifer variabilis]USD19804.1 hypothetical protein MJO52_12000 [Microbulbifer variabilis]